MLLMLQPGDLRLPSWHCVWVLLKCSARCFRVYEISTPGERQFSKASCKLSLSRMCTLTHKCLLATSFACPKLRNLLFLMQRVFAGAGISTFLKRRTPWRSACDWDPLKHPLLCYLQLLTTATNPPGNLVILMRGKINPNISTSALEDFTGSV